MGLLFAVIGAIGGALAFQFVGFGLGAVLGYLLGDNIAQRKRIGALERETADLRQAGLELAEMVLRGPRAQTEQTSEATATEAPEQARLAKRDAAPKVQAAATQIPRPPDFTLEPLPQPAATAPEERFDIAEAYATLGETPLPARGPARPSARAPAEKTQGRSASDDSARPPTRFDPMSWIVSYFTGGNVVVRVGVIVLFFGVAFLLKYASEHVDLPIELRLIAVAVGAVALLVIGWRLRAKRANYALMLQSAGVGVLYLLVFAALRLYQLLPPGAAFGLLVAIVAFSAALAVMQNSLAFAVFGVTGGFLAPILTSTGQGSHVALFSYYAVLNAGILAMAWFKPWRALNLLGFAFTFIIGTAWGVMRYQPELRWSTEPFLALFFVFYVTIAILYATRQAPRLKGYVDGTLVFGTPLAAFGLQTALVRDLPYALAYSALAVGAFYLVLATLLYQRKQETLRLLVEAFLALGVAFATLAIPLALDGRWTAASWALEGATIAWVGVRQNRLLARLSGVLLQFAAGLAFFFELGQPVGALPIANSFFVGCVLISFAALFTAWYLRRHLDVLRPAEHSFVATLFTWGLLWWLFAGGREIESHARAALIANALAAFIVITAIACFVAIGVRQRFALARYYAAFLLFSAGAVFVITRATTTQDSSWLTAIWLGCLIISSGALFIAGYAHRHSDGALPLKENSSPALAAWGLLWWLAGGLSEIHLRYEPVWWAAAALLFFTVTALACSLLARRLRWPLLRVPALALLAGMLAVTNYQIGSALHPFAHLGYLAWPAAFVAYYWFLRRHEHEVHHSVLRVLHVATLWLLAALASWEVAWQIDRAVGGAGTWPLIAWLVVPSALLLALSTCGQRLVWPVAAHWSTYLAIGTLPPAIFLVLWSLATNLFSTGDPAPLPYLPLLNPLDLAQAFTFICLATWMLKLRREQIAWIERVPRRFSYGALAALAFVWLNAILLRTLHYWAGVAYHFDIMWRSTLVQTAFSIFWSMLALAIMLFATRKALRMLWFVGAALMAVVVVKLFTIDISNVGGLARIVSFIGVAILMLIIGYIAPVPPKRAEHSK